MDQLNPSEISELIKQRIAKADIAVSAKNEGTIVSVSDGIVRIYGLADVMYGEMIEFEGGVYGMALNLERDSGAVVLGDYQKLAEGQTARCTGRILEVPVGNGLLGRVVDALGNPVDGKETLNLMVPTRLRRLRRVLLPVNQLISLSKQVSRRSMRWSRSAAVSASSLLVTVRLVKPQSQSMRSLIKKAQA